jgi:hypothetical protein
MDAGITPIDPFIPRPGYREITGRQQIEKPGPSERGVTVARWSKSCEISCYSMPGQTRPALRPRSIRHRRSGWSPSRRSMSATPGTRPVLLPPRFPETPLGNPAHHVLVPGLVFHDLPDQGRGEVRGARAWQTHTCIQALPVLSVREAVF